MSNQVYKLAHVLHIENLKDVKHTAAVLEQVTSESLRLKYHKKCSFVVVRDTFEAFEQMSLKRFDCVIIDERVEFSAYEAIQTIRTLIPDIPILIILPAHNFEVALEDSGSVGCTHALERDYTSEQYCTALQSMLNMPQEQIFDIPSVTHFPWEVISPPIHEIAANTANFQNFQLLQPHQYQHLHQQHTNSPVDLVTAQETSSQSLPPSLLAHPSMSPDSLLQNAMQFFSAQRSAANKTEGATSTQPHVTHHEETITHEDQPYNTTLQVEDFALDSESFQNAMNLFNATDNKTTV
jgi:hypothetical protein